MALCHFFEAPLRVSTGFTHRAEAVWLLGPPSLHLLSGFCQSFWTSRPRLYLPGWPYNPWFLVRASGLLLGGGGIPPKKKTKGNQNNHQQKWRASPKAPSVKRAKAKVEQDDFPFDECQQKWRGPFIRGGQRRALRRKKTKMTPRRENDFLKTPNTTASRHVDSSFSHLGLFFPFRQRLEVAWAFWLGFEPMCTIRHQSGVNAHGPRSCVETNVPAVEKHRTHTPLPPRQAESSDRTPANTFHGTPFSFPLPLGSVFSANMLMPWGPTHSSPRWDLSRLRPHPSPPVKFPSVRQTASRQRRHLPTLKAAPPTTFIWEERPLALLLGKCSLGVTVPSPLARVCGQLEVGVISIWNGVHLK